MNKYGFQWTGIRNFPWIEHSKTAPVHENTGFCGQTVSKSTSVHEIVDSGGQDAKQPEFYVEP